MPQKTIAMALSVAAIIMLTGRISSAAVIVFDRVAVIDQPVQLAVRTGGRFLSMGGQLVVLSVGGTRLRQILTGGDGYGYLMYTPTEIGLKKITAVHNDQRETARLLVLSADARVILIDVETALRESAIAPRLREDSRQAMESLNREYQIIYLYTLTGQNLNRQWLDSNGLPASVILAWRDAAPVRALERLGISTHAIVGSANQLKSSNDTIAHRFSFEDTKEGLRVKSWAQVLEALQAQGASGSR